MVLPPAMGTEAIHSAGLAVNGLDLTSPEEIRRAIPMARQAALVVKTCSESKDWKAGDFTGMPVALFQNWLSEQNREWHFADGTLAVIWSIEFPHARCDYAQKHKYVASTRGEYNAGRHQAPTPPAPSVAYGRDGRPVDLARTPRTARPTPPARLPQPAESGTRTVRGIAPARTGRPSAALRRRTTDLSFTSDPERTRARVDLLDKYMAEHVLTKNSFVCRDFEACQRSHAGVFYEGQLHHVGNHYDMKLNGRPFRIAVVGQEYGNGPARVQRQTRTIDVALLTGRDKRFRSDGLHAGRNQHMRGTTSVLRLLLGTGLGTDYAGEHLALHSESVHIFQAFALTNFLLCTAIEAGQSEVGSKRGHSTSIMQRNCARHFSAAMEILEPTVLVVQGRSVRRWLQRVLRGVRTIAANLERAEVGAQQVLVASFTHPSAPNNETNWGNDERRPYLLEVVAPTVDSVHAEIMS